MITPIGLDGYPECSTIQGIFCISERLLADRFYLDGQKVGTVTTNANGGFTLSVSLPRKLAKGVHSLQVAGVAKVNQVRAVTAALVIAGETRFTARFAVYFLGDSPKITAKCGDLLRAIRNLLKGKKSITVTVNGWVKETKIKKNDLQLSSARAGTLFT